MNETNGKPIMLANGKQKSYDYQLQVSGSANPFFDLQGMKCVEAGGRPLVDDDVSPGHLKNCWQVEAFSWSLSGPGLTGVREMRSFQEGCTARISRQVMLSSLPPLFAASIRSAAGLFE